MGRGRDTRRGRAVGSAGAAFAAMLALSVPAEADEASFESLLCRRYYDAAKYAAAFPFCRKGAEAGLSEAMFALGVVYDEGRGVPQNYGRALFWWRKAAEVGHAGAMFNLGVVYEFGPGVPRDFVRAHM
ncbi:MAG: tetratricopeptide repeat protein [Geminicoccaceae bacterium]|nr:tetratricopeptide repeat protein [Geminicoccaceae bacterium]